MPRDFGFMHQHHHNLAMQERDQVTSLAEMMAGEKGTVLAFHGDGFVNRRLTSLGFTPGVQVDMIRNYGHGPLIVTVRGTRVALGRGEASKIEVRRGINE
mgnify:CR=1 FL=1